MINLPKLAKMVVYITVILIIIQVIVANRLTTVGLTLTNLEKQKNNLNEENNLLERKVATFSAMTNIAQKAAEAGFTKAVTYYLTPQFPVALGNLNGAAR